MIFLMEINVKISFISTGYFFWFSNMILSDALILPVSIAASNTASDDVTN